MSKDKFFKVYSNLPEDIRHEIIVVIDKKPYTWDAVFLELSNDTLLGKKMLEKILEMEVL